MHEELVFVVESVSQWKKQDALYIEHEATLRCGNHAVDFDFLGSSFLESVKIGEKYTVTLTKVEE